MARQMTPSQYNNWVQQQQNRLKQEVDRVNRINKAAADKWVRDANNEINRVNRHNKQVVDDHNRRVLQHNQNARAAVSKYNQAIRAHNTQVERDRQRNLSALRNHTSTQYLGVRNSTLELSTRFEQIERTTQTSLPADLLDISHREAGNSAAVAHALDSEAPQTPEITEDTGILEYLSGFSQDLCDRWRGALFALNPANTDAGRHFCTSVREIFTEILDRWADDERVTSSNPNCERTQLGTPSRRAKIQYLLRKKGADSPEMLGFVEKDIEDILQLFKVFNEATHGAAGKHGFTKLLNIRQRVEGGIMFLAAIAL